MIYPTPSENLNISAMLECSKLHPAIFPVDLPGSQHVQMRSTILQHNWDRRRKAHAATLVFHGLVPGSCMYMLQMSCIGTPYGLCRVALCIPTWLQHLGYIAEHLTANVMMQEAKNNMVSKLHEILKPFLLRRIKSDVEASLPAKQEIVLYAPLTDLQKEIQSKIMQKTLISEVCDMAKQTGSRVSRPLSRALCSSFKVHV